MAKRRYFAFTGLPYESADVTYLDSFTGEWKPARPELLRPNLREWFLHNVMGKHFSYGQPFCVVCGLAGSTEETNTREP
jgi:hypothetical protein